MEINKLELKNITLDASKFEELGKIMVRFKLDNFPYRFQFGREKAGNWIAFAVIHDTWEEECPLCGKTRDMPCEKFEPFEKEMLDRLIKEKSVRLKLVTEGIFERKK